MIKKLQIFLLSLSFIWAISCTPEPVDTNVKVNKANITVTVQSPADMNVAKYEVGIKDSAGKQIVSRKAISTSYTFSVNAGTYTFYAFAYDSEKNIIGKIEKQETISDGSEISLSIQPLGIAAIFNISPEFAVASCITQVKIKVSGDENDYYLPYEKNNPIIFDEFSKEGSYTLDISLVDDNKIAYYETRENITIGEAGMTRDIEFEQIKVTPPSFNITDSSVSPKDKITLSCETETAYFYYTLDGSAPTKENGTRYSGYITLPTDKNSVTLKIIAVADGLEDSKIIEATYNINIEQISAPTISPKGTTFEKSLEIEINHENENALIYYTLDNSEPTKESLQYTDKFYIYTTLNIKAVAYVGDLKSTSVTQSYILDSRKLEPPTITVDGNQITLSHKDANAVIYYTTDDNIPDQSSSKYQRAFTIDNSTKDIVVKAKAFRNGYISSEIAEEVLEALAPSTAAPKVTITPESGKSIASTQIITINVESDTLLTADSSASINGEDYTLIRGKNNFRVADIASIEGTVINIKVTAENRAGKTAKSMATFTVADQKLSGKFNELRIYQVMVEAFQSGNALGFYQGYGPSKHDGDIRGIINALDYIKGLGMNALWLTPVFDTNADNLKDKKLAATGYYAYDYFSIEPNFGTIEDFKELVAECHKRNMYIILDGVFGHWSELGVKPSPSGISPERSHGMYAGCDYPGTNNCTLEFFKEVATYWIKNYKIDGWRLDQCYQTGMGNGSMGDGTYTNGHNYWYEIRTAVEEAANANGTPGIDWGSLGYMVGEHWNGDDSYPPTIQKLSVAPGSAAGYGLRSCFDFPSRYKLVQMFAMEESKKKGGEPLTLLDYVFKSAKDKGYNHPSNDIRSDNYVPNLFITNHDLVRFGDLVTWKYQNNEYYKRHKVALSTLAAYTGPITIYYGDEIGEKSGTTISGDNVARTGGRISDFSSEEQDLHDYVAKLMTIRNENEALWDGTYTKLDSRSNFFAAKKSKDGQEIVYLVNYSGSSINYNVGSSGTDLMTGNSTSSTVSVPALSAMFIKTR
jgi:glycosidase